MNLPVVMSGHDRTYQPPRALRAEVGGPFTAWELFGLTDGPAGEWAQQALNNLVASIDVGARGTLGCTECEETGFYGSVDLADDDLLTGLIRRSADDEFETLTAAGTWVPWTDPAPLEVLSLDLAMDLAEAITAGASGLLRRYVTPRAWLPPSAVVAAVPLSELVSAARAATPQDSAEVTWLEYAVVDEIDQGAVLDLVRITAAGDAAEYWDGSTWTPDAEVFVATAMPMVRLDKVQLSEVQVQFQRITGSVNKALQNPPKCHYCVARATRRILHSEGMAYTPTCDNHLAKGEDDAAHCTPGGVKDPTNIVRVDDYITASALQAIVADAPLTVSPDPRAEKLRRYWSSGKGAAKIRWGMPGDWRRCYKHLRKYMGLRAKGYCQNMHKRNNGFWTGDRRNRGLRGAALSPEETLLASVRAHRWVRESGRDNTMTDTTGIADGVYSEADPANGGIMSTLVAGGFPVKPPGSWFENPKLTGPTPIDVTDEGRVFGHIAPWGVSHIGMAGSVVTPKNSNGKYPYFRTGAVRTEEGEDVHVGQLTLVGGHAPISATAAQAVRHYDDTNSAVADVVVGEDQYGIWAAGALRPTVTPEQVRAMRACPPSGDWRPINGHLELVAACHVNVQGFPIAKALYASGAVTALVAAGAREMYLLKASQIGEPVLAAKVAELEKQLAVLASAAVIEAPAAEPVDAVVETPAVEPAAEPAVVEEIVEAEIIDEADATPTEEELATADKISSARDAINQIKREQLRARVRGSGAPVTAALPPQFLANKKGADDKDSGPADVPALKTAIKAAKSPAEKSAAKKAAFRLKRPDLIPTSWKA